MKHSISEIQISYRPNKLKSNFKITHSQMAYEVILEHWDDDIIELQEEFKILLLNNSNEPLGIHCLSKGGITFAGVDLRILFAIALKSGATGLITVHNHPSGRLIPSQADKNIYNRIKQSCDILNLNYLDNLIITKNGYFSFMDENL
ncbi:JAB domain-containing protein [uncultured Winogradskyella sp.]|uniref:JAB domain-containing protein n=1 Tax=uncultured Winogradskyella sp. TaxID=395353 RepID=UPI003516D079